MVLNSRGVHAALHYLDDFLVLGPPGQPVCKEALHATLMLCEELRFPVAEEKTGPTTVLTFLGIEIDTWQQQVRLPQEKLQLLASTIASWMKPSAQSTPHRSAMKRDLLSLLGLLHHVVTVVRPGRACRASSMQPRRYKTSIIGFTSTAQLGQTLHGGIHSSGPGMGSA